MTFFPESTMELNRSYNPGYFSLEDILATQERVPCHVEKELKDVGFLDPGSESADLAKGTRLELPYWMAEVTQSAPTLNKLCHH